MANLVRQTCVSHYEYVHRISHFTNKKIKTQVWHTFARINILKFKVLQPEMSPILGTGISNLLKFVLQNDEEEPLS